MTLKAKIPFRLARKGGGDPDIKLKVKYVMFDLDHWFSTEVDFALLETSEHI